MRRRKLKWLWKRLKELLCSAIIDAAADPSVMSFIRKRCGMIGGC